MYIDSRVMPRSRTKASFVLLAGGREGRGGRGKEVLEACRDRRIVRFQRRANLKEITTASSPLRLEHFSPRLTHSIHTPCFPLLLERAPCPLSLPPPVGVPIFASCALSSSSSSSSSFIASSPSQTTRMSYLCSGKKFSKFRERFFPVSSSIQRRIRWSSKANYFIERI